MDKRFIEITKKNIVGLIGLFVVLIAGAVYLLLQDNIVVNYHDQLDGEVIGYLLHAKYLFQGVKEYPEMMNGISPNGLFMPAPLAVFFYKFFSPYMAFILNAIFCMICGYVGMYLCVKQITGYQSIAAIAGVLFAYLPLLSVYGLSQYGLPLLFYAFYLLYKKEHVWSSLLLVALYGAMSSLVLVGYAILFFGALFYLYLIIKKTWKQHIWLAIGGLLLACIYIAVNYELVLQILGYNETYPSHKEVIMRYGQDFWNSFVTIFVRGTVHTPTHQIVIVIYATILGVLSIFTLKKASPGIKHELYALYLFYFLNLFFAFFYACYQSPFVADLRNRLGGIFKEFQADRLFWLSVPLWYLILGICLHISWETVKYLWKCHRYVICAGVLICSSVFLLGSAAVVFYYSDFNKNLHRLKDGEKYEQITWNDFYAPDIFEQIDEYIGKDKSSFRTLSFGVYPAAALYNGYYCLDGYSNNYSLKYMKKFRNIIDDELAKDDALRTYFDQWGCRCYLLSAELGSNRFMYPKGNKKMSESTDFDFKEAKKMGAKYVFSSMKLPEDEEVTLVRPEPFKTETSYYEIYLYEIK